eukprot:EG_transcript_12300
MPLGPALLAMTHFTDRDTPGATPHRTCDAVLATADGSLRCHVHRDVLRVRAPALAALLPQAGPALVVPGSPAVLRALVAFLYTGVAPLGGCQRADLATLLAAAEESALPGLAAPVRLKLHPVTEVQDVAADASPDLGTTLLMLHTDPTLANTRVTHQKTGTVWYASAVVLAARSQYFQRLFSGPWLVDTDADGRWQVEIPEEVSVEVAADVLRYAHSADGRLSWLPADAVQRAADLAEGSRYFALLELEEDAVAYLCRRLRVSNVPEIWARAASLGSEDLQDAVVRFCLGSFPALAADAVAFRAVPRELLHTLLLGGRLPVATPWLEQQLLRWARLQLVAVSEVKLKVPLDDNVCHEYIRDLLPPATLFCQPHRAAVLGLPLPR